jgi:hypothetical protein
MKRERNKRDENFESFFSILFFVTNEWMISFNSIHLSDARFSLLLVN